MSSISFANVTYFFIILPLAVLFAVPFFLAVRKDNRNGHNVASAVIHLVLAVAIGFAAAGTRIVTVLTETQVYVVADVSYSADRNLDVIDDYIGNLSKSLPANSEIGVVCFGKDAEVLSSPGESLKSVKKSPVDRSETDIVGALEYTGGLFDENCIKRIVLITDAKASDRRDENALKRTVESLRSRKIKVDAIYLDDNLPETASEVQISEAEVTRTTYLGHAEYAIAYVRSSYETNAQVGVTKDGEAFLTTYTKLTPGTNAVRFRLDTEQTGTFRYEVTVTVDGDDESAVNNSYAFEQTVSGNLQVLAISGTSADNKAVRELYGGQQNVTLTTYYTDLTKLVPASVEELCKYDVIVLNNLDVRDLTYGETFVESLDTVVASFGKSLVTLGDTSIISREDRVLRQLGDMLPVQYARDTESKLYTLVIDSSLSMEYASRMTMAKKAANYLLGLANDNDKFCIVNFYGTMEVPLTPTQVGNNREYIAEVIDGLTCKQGTYIGEGLNEALNQIINYDIAEKQVILISDGLNYMSGDEYDPVNIVTKLRAENILTTVIDVGRSGNSSDATADAVALLQNIAAAGGSSYFFADTEEKLDAVLLGDFTSLIVDAYSDTPSPVTIKTSGDASLYGLDSLPDVGGFYTSSVKNSASTVLTVKYIDEENMIAKTMPLYAHWDYGNGTVATFTGNISGDWLDGWETALSSGETVRQTFFSNLLQACYPEEKIDVPYTVGVETEGKYARVEVQPALVRPDAAVSLRIALPDGAQTEDGETVTVEMTFDTDRYVCDVELGSAGFYGVEVVYSYGGKEYTSDISFDVPFTAEYDSFEVYEASALYKAVVNSGGTVSEDGTLSIVNDESEISKATLDLTIPLLAACVILYLADVVVRKLKWNDVKNLFVKVNKKSKS